MGNMDIIRWIVVLRSTQWHQSCGWSLTPIIVGVRNLIGELG